MKRAIVAVALLAGYAWATAGVKPFSTVSYVLVAIPSVATVLACVALGGLSPRRPEISAYYLRKAGGASLPTVAPWIAVLSAAVVLEAVGLLLGGRSASVPTLSTTVDHLLAVRWERCLLCFAWLRVGVIPLIGLRRLSQARDL
jgi:hypothetical protein